MILTFISTSVIFILSKKQSNQTDLTIIDFLHKENNKLKDSISTINMKLNDIKV